MANIIIPPDWQEKQLQPISEQEYYNRRNILKKLGILTGGLLTAPAVLAGCEGNKQNKTQKNQAEPGINSGNNVFGFPGMDKMYPAPRNQQYQVSRELTQEYAATHYNNFYEFISRDLESIYNVYKNVDPFDTSDWKFEVSGLADNTGIFSLEDIMKKFDLEERVYRFRCVEAWSMVVPWTGIPMHKLVKYFAPQNKAKYIRMVSYSDPDQMIGVKQQEWYPWPYFEGVRIDEAMNELTLLTTGIFGKPLPKQNGAPMRLIVPWKYGYKNIKSIVRFEFVAEQPETFWHTLAPDEYPFISNVNPDVPHPRWSQASETLIPDEEKVPTLMYNGYEKFVSGLYK
ncbi:MAG: protein-methionine-sulfoxide reductase catalytic subunit MsrP [Candidatus Cyclobacteriaceae bacterium M3_2C_046]